MGTSKESHIAFSANVTGSTISVSDISKVVVIKDQMTMLASRGFFHENKPKPRVASAITEINTIFISLNRIVTVVGLVSQGLSMLQGQVLHLQT